MPYRCLRSVTAGHVLYNCWMGILNYYVPIEFVCVDSRCSYVWPTIHYRCSVLIVVCSTIPPHTEVPACSGVNSRLPLFLPAFLLLRSVPLFYDCYSILTIPPPHVQITVTLFLSHTPTPPLRLFVTDTILCHYHCRSVRWLRYRTQISFPTTVWFLHRYILFILLHNFSTFLFTCSFTLRSVRVHLIVHSYVVSLFTWSGDTVPFWWLVDYITHIPIPTPPTESPITYILYPYYRCTFSTTLRYRCSAVPPVRLMHSVSISTLTICYSKFGIRGRYGVHSVTIFYVPFYHYDCSYWCDTDYIYRLFHLLVILRCTVTWPGWYIQHSWWVVILTVLPYLLFFCSHKFLKLLFILHCSLLFPRCLFRLFRLHCTFTVTTPRLLLPHVDFLNLRYPFIPRSRLMPDYSTVPLDTCTCSPLLIVSGTLPHRLHFCTVTRSTTVSYHCQGSRAFCSVLRFWFWFLFVYTGCLPVLLLRCVPFCYHRHLRWRRARSYHFCHTWPLVTTTPLLHQIPFLGGSDFTTFPARFLPILNFLSTVRRRTNYYPLTYYTAFTILHSTTTTFLR